MDRRQLFLPAREVHKTIIAQSLVTINADKATYAKIETELEELLNKNVLNGKAWNEMYECSAKCASYENDLQAQMNKTEKLEQEISERLEKHSDQLAALLQPVETIAEIDEPPFPMVEAAWGMILQDRSSLEKIREQDPESFNSLFDDENIRLDKRSKTARAFASQAQSSLIIKDSQATSSSQDIQSVWSQMDTTSQETIDFMAEIKARDTKIARLQADLVTSEGKYNVESQGWDIQRGRYEALQATNQRNQEVIDGLQQDIKRLEEEAVELKKDAEVSKAVEQLNTSRLKDQEEERAKYEDMVKALRSIEAALDTIGPIALPGLKYVQSTQGRLEMLDELGNARQSDIKHQQSAKTLEEQLRKEIVRLKEAQMSNILSTRITENKLKAALLRGKSLETWYEREWSENENIVQDRNESNRRAMLEKDTLIVELNLQKSQLDLEIHRLARVMNDWESAFRKQTVLLAEMAKDRAGKVRHHDAMVATVRAHESELDELDTKYVTHIEQAMDYVLLSIPWEDLEYCLNIYTFDDLTSRLLLIPMVEKDYMAPIYERTWKVANPFELTRWKDTTPLCDHYRAFSLAVRLYTLVACDQQYSSSLGFRMINQLYTKLVNSEDSFGPTVFMISMDLYMSRLRRAIHIEVEDAIFALIMYQLWWSVDKSWPGIWPLVCPKGGRYNPADLIKEKLQGIDTFVRDVIRMLVGLTSRTESLVGVSLPDRAAALGLLGAQLVNRFPSVIYENRVVVTEKDSQYLVLLVEGPSCKEITIIEKMRFSFSEDDTTSLGLTFVSEDGKHVFRNEEFSEKEEWWQKMVGPHMSTTLQADEIARRMALLAPFEQEDQSLQVL